MYYGEEFIEGDATFGSYVCELTLSDPDGFTMQAGGPGTFVTPAARPTVFPSPVRTEGRAVLAALQTALQRADGTAKATDTRRLDLHDGREATCLALFRVYATLLLEFADKPAKVAAYFDFSKAVASKPSPKAPKAAPESR